MRNSKQSSCFECAVWVSALSLALLLPTAALAGDDGGDEISAAIARTSEPLLLFLCGCVILATATAFKRKLRRDIPPESSEPPAFGYQGIGTEPLIFSRGEQWELGDREALSNAGRSSGEESY